MFIIGCPGGKINMAVISSKRGMACPRMQLIINGMFFSANCSSKICYQEACSMFLVSYPYRKSAWDFLKRKQMSQLVTTVNVKRYFMTVT